MAGVDYLYFIQRNTLNRRERTLHIEVHNETFSSRVFVKELCNYTVRPPSLLLSPIAKSELTPCSLVWSSLAPSELTPCSLLWSDKALSELTPCSLLWSDKALSEVSSCGLLGSNVSSDLI